MSATDLDLTLVIPLYNEEESLPELMAWIDRVVKANDIHHLEAILIDDGSTDESWLSQHCITHIPGSRASGSGVTMASLLHCKKDLKLPPEM